MTLGELSPEQKAEWIIHRRRQFPRSVVAMVGDGINDTPTFAHGDLSLAMGPNGDDPMILSRHEMVNLEKINR